MTNTAAEAAIASWIAATNTHDTTKYLSYFTEDAVLNDPSVGQSFEGKHEIAEYFNSYFIGYNTQTRLVSVEPRADYFHVEVNFSGDFPGGQTSGIFDLTFAAELISLVRADLR